MSERIKKPKKRRWVLIIFLLLIGAGVSYREYKKKNPSDLEKAIADIPSPKLRENVECIFKWVRNGWMSNMVHSVIDEIPDNPVTDKIEESMVTAISCADAGCGNAIDNFAWAIGRDPDSKYAIKPLMFALFEENERVRDVSMGALSAIASEGKTEVLPALLLALQHKYPDVNYSAANTLPLLGTKAKSAIPALILNLKDPNVAVRTFNAYALGKIAGAEDTEAIEALKSALNDPEQGVRIEAAVALANLAGSTEPEDILPILKHALNYRQRLHGMEDIYIALGKIGSDAKEILPDLRAELKSAKKKHEHREVIESIEKAIQQIEGGDLK